MLFPLQLVHEVWPRQPRLSCVFCLDTLLGSTSVHEFCLTTLWSNHLCWCDLSPEKQVPTTSAPSPCSYNDKREAQDINKSELVVSKLHFYTFSVSSTVTDFIKKAAQLIWWETTKAHIGYWYTVYVNQVTHQFYIFLNFCLDCGLS